MFRRVCHDLRAPLHGIAGLAEDLIIKAKRAAASTETAEAILYSGQRLGFMINDILDASKLKNKKMELNVNVGNLKKEVNKVVYSLKAAKDMSSGNSLVADRVALRNDVAEGLPNVKADLHRLSQVLYNLVGNVSLNPYRFYARLLLLQWAWVAVEHTANSALKRPAVQ